MQLLPIRIIYHAPITLSDGTVLSAMIWVPENAETKPVPAILEYLPYRKSDMTAERDATNMPYVAGRGYACVRVDMRGTGDSQGLILGEYLKQEQDDALEVLSWIGSQKWCTGSCGMIGISWGGFNSLQVAARKPKELKAIVTICSTDDRYEDDIHYMGGCMLTENFTWAASMFAINSCPPDPAVVGDQWRDLWLQRLESGGFFAKEWHENQRRNEFWKHGSICEDYSDIEAATYLVGGWQDPYTNTVFRMLENLKCPKKGVVGPWGHKYPNFAKPGPQIGFLQETVRWWDKWLKGIDEDNIMEEPQLRCYLQDPWPPAPHDKFRPGQWIAESKWSDEKVHYRRMGLAPGQLTEKTSSSNGNKVQICSPQTNGFAGGRWLIFGVEGEGPSDQRLEAGGSLIFDTEPLEKSLDLLGAATLNVRVASDKPDALLAATLSEVLPNGAATRISYGVLNLTHRNGHEDLQKLEPGKFYDIKVKLNHFAQRLGAGNKLRLALSSTYFPIIWPSPEMTTLTIDTGSSSIDLPERKDDSQDSKLKPFRPAINGSLKKTQIRPANHKNYVKTDWDTGRTELVCDWDDGEWEIDETGWRFGWTTPMTMSVHPNDPTSAELYQGFDREFERGKDFKVGFTGWAKMTATKEEWIMTGRIDAWEGEKKTKVFEKDYEYRVKRDHV